MAGLSIAAMCSRILCNYRLFRRVLAPTQGKSTIDQHSLIEKKVPIFPPFDKGGQGDFKMSKRVLLYNSKLKGIARNLRTNMTQSERMLWSRLRGKQLLGVQFYRQKPIGNYIVDFFAPRVKLVIEVDGSQHAEADHFRRDKQRDSYLADLGIRVMRFNSREVLKDTDSVVDLIYRSMEESLD